MRKVKLEPAANYKAWKQWSSSIYLVHSKCIILFNFQPYVRLYPPFVLESGVGNMSDIWKVEKKNV